MTVPWGVRVRRVWCPACDEGWVGHFVTRAGNTTLFVCNACQATWPSSGQLDPAESRSLADVLIDLDLPPGPEGLADASPEVWFADLGYTLAVSQDTEGVFWAALGSVNNPDFLVGRYGRGASPTEAADSARRRWQTEQIGSPTAYRRGRRRPLPP